MTREAFENAIVVNSAIGGSTNAPIHLNAIARHLGVKLDNDDWQTVGHKVPLLVNLQPSGEYLGEDYHHAGGVPAVVMELMKGGLLPHPDALTVNGKSMGENCKGVTNENPDVIRSVGKPLKADAGFINLKGNLFDSAIMKTSVISPEFRDALPVQSGGPGSLRGQRHRVRRTGGLPRPHRRSGAGHRRAHASCSCAAPARSAIRAAPKSSTCSRRPISSRRASMRSPASAMAASRARRARRRSSTPRPKPPSAAVWRWCAPATASASTSGRATANILISDEELAARRAALNGNGGYHYPKHQTPWQEIQRGMVDQFDQGMVLKPAVKYQHIAQTSGVPRDNH